jgi:hypothetical protein
MAPFVETSVIEHLQIVCNDEGDDAISEAFFEHDEASYSTITILKRMNLLETHMKIEDIFKRLLFDDIVFR